MSLARTVAVAAIAMIGTSAVAADKPKVVTTFTVIADMAENVAGDHAEVVSITKPGAEIHGYSPTPRDILNARDGDIILSNGLNLERWFEKFLQNLGDVPNVVVSEGIDPIDIAGGEYDGKPNPHAWMSPDSAEIYVMNIRDALIEIDPDNAEAYTENARAYADEIAARLQPMRAMLADVPEEKRWLVTSEGAFSYLARDLDLKELYLWPVNADQQGTPQQIRHVIDTMKENDIHVIFSESTVSDKPARQIARETGADYGGVLYVDSLSDPDGPVPTYLDLLSVTTETVAKGLTE
ncbi:MAG: iron ABC transporter substrate-binding protein [Martelella sp.]|uniref:metal ABC transporter substrate-binding protein n=1 Tax=Martelella sp. TaxID=1969699 RepID=UPI000C5680C7|nr:metal ABC transporter substrate-binding protein [Martelella sp.]MAU19048.1 iron ABC transporter substrate-binding protein [Martelella sp.]|tara:strand:- start:680 stop:1564 length:885 start_codon:yes stop_codon:yes gene_type:complete